MNWTELVAEHLELLSRCENLGLEEAARMIHRAIDRGGKVICCGNGGSHAHAQHFAAELAVRYRKERRAFAAIALGCNPAIVTATVNDLGPDHLFSREFLSIARSEDLLFAISTSGGSSNVLRVVDAARQEGVPSIGMTGVNGMAREVDHEIRVPSPSTARIQELHQMIIHSLCELIDA